MTRQAILNVTFKSLEESLKLKSEVKIVDAARLAWDFNTESISIKIESPDLEPIPEGGALPTIDIETVRREE